MAKKGYTPEQIINKLNFGKLEVSCYFALQEIGRYSRFYFTR